MPHLCRRRSSDSLFICLLAARSLGYLSEPPTFGPGLGWSSRLSFGGAHDCFSAEYDRCALCFLGRGDARDGIRAAEAAIHGRRYAAAARPDAGMAAADMRLAAVSGRCYISLHEPLSNMRTRRSFSSF